MGTHAKVWFGGLGLLALGVFLPAASESDAGDKADPKSAILKIAAAISKGESAAATSQAKSLAKKIEDIAEVMNLMKPRTKKGFGVGDKPGAIKPDGIELKLIDMGRDAPTQDKANKEARALEEMAYRVAAIAEVAMIYPPKDEPKAKQKLWIKLATELREAVPKLAAAAKSKSPAELKDAAALINSSCNSCHSEFK